jgi:hypothetical protein
METKAKIGEEVVIVETAWIDDSVFYIGYVGTLISLETHMEWATVKTPDMVEQGYVAVKHYAKATPLLKALL